MHQKDFKTYSYFSWHVQVMAVGLSIVGLFLLTTNVLMGILTLSICAFIFTTHYRFRIDLVKKEFQDYLWILGLRQGATVRYEKMEYFFIKKSNVSQTMGLKAATTTVHKEVFDAYLKFSEKEKVFIVSQNSKEKLLSQLHPMATSLQVQIIDYTEGNAVIQ